MLFDLLLPLYPIKRIVYQYYSLNVLSNDRNVPKFKDIRMDIKKLNGYFAGFGLSSGSILIRLVFPYLIGQDSLIISSALFIITYPLQLNSIYKSLNIPDYRSLKDINNIKELFLNKKNYRGILYTALGEFVSIIPFLNYKFNSIEQTRIAFILGEQNGLKFETYRDAKQHIKEKGNFKRGRFLINVTLTIYNVCWIPFILNLIIE